MGLYHGPGVRQVLAPLKIKWQGVQHPLTRREGSLAGIRRGLLDSPVRVSMRGGELVIAWDGAAGGAPAPVMMTGPAVTVFTAEIALPNNLRRNWDLGWKLYRRKPLLTIGLEDKYTKIGAFLVEVFFTQKRPRPKRRQRSVGSFFR